MKILRHIVVSGTSTTEIQISNVEQDYTDLVLLAAVRTSRSGSSDGLRIRFGSSGNVDTNVNNYKTTYIQGDGSNDSSGTVTNSKILFGLCPATDNTADQYSNNMAYIYNYTSNSNKTLSMDTISGAGANNYQFISGGIWTSSGAIDTIVVAGDLGNYFIPGSTVTLYGVLKGSDGTTAVS